MATRQRAYKLRHNSVSWRATWLCSDKQSLVAADGRPARGCVPDRGDIKITGVWLGYNPNTWLTHVRLGAGQIYKAAVDSQAHKVWQDPFDRPACTYITWINARLSCKWWVDYAAQKAQKSRKTLPMIQTSWKNKQIKQNKYSFEVEWNS